MDNTVIPLRDRAAAGTRRGAPTGRPDRAHAEHPGRRPQADARATTVYAAGPGSDTVERHPDAHPEHRRATQAVRGSARPGALSYDRADAGSAPTTPASPKRSTRRSERRRSRTQLPQGRPVSVRGRRTAALDTRPLPLVRGLAAGVTVVLIALGLTLWLNGVTTAQAYELSEARGRSSMLAKELETLRRDLAFTESSASLAQRAAELGMVVPSQAGVLDVRGPQGAEIVETRPADPTKTRPVIDVNGRIRPNPATTDSSTQGAAAQQPGIAAHSATAPGGLPYAPGVRQPQGAAPAPAPAPAPALAPAGAALPASAPQPAPAPADAAAPAPAPAPAPAAPAPQAGQPGIAPPTPTH